ncbi:MAG: 1-deoxy-D-xylulose-5-phosphate reductoisomerase [Huintestinicola sp.]|uniref:1-deoxy-D-xylulose-5-phosphate reductoisomerase n=1 Tax=Huintestinicola sp. TaxID=2981661 RepID=UPI003F0588A3
MMMKKINLLGSGGSIGTQTLEVCRRHGFEIHSAAVKSNYKRLAEQAREFKIKRVCIFDEKYYKPLKDALADSDTEVLAGLDGLCELASDRTAELTVNAVVGMVGLKPTIAALESGIQVALANKETLVAGGDIVMKLAAEKGITILPIDSEHSAVFQCLMGVQGDVNKQLKGIILTASGGPFFGMTADELEEVTIQQALCHPNWSMGRKITIDSATMMNKGLELIEACHLFGVSPSQVEIVVHRQSIVHSAVVLSDNAVIAQLGVPDMKIPIQLALTYPERCESLSGKLSLTDYGTLTFQKPDYNTFLCLRAAVKAARTGGTAGSIVNGANERAVELFLAGKIGFGDIGRGVSGALDNITVRAADTLEAVLAADAEARDYINSRFC